MRALLLHKNIEVASIECECGTISEVKEILNRNHMPVGTFLPDMTNAMCCVYLQAWQRARMIPSDRINLQEVLRHTDKDIFLLGLLGHGMGLTDQYWIKKQGETILWEDVSFYRNGFQPSTLTLLGEGEVSISPDYGTNGTLPKSWVVFDNIPMLLKDSPPGLATAAANEVVAYQIASACGIRHAQYYPIRIGDRVVCASPCFVGGDQEEFVSMLAYMRTHRGSFLQIADQFGLNRQFLLNMTAFDLLIGNTDRRQLPTT